MMDSGHNSEGGDRGAVVGLRRNGRRVFAHDFKLSLVRRCLEPGVSVAAVAMAHQVNANLLRKWIIKHRAEVAPGVVPVAIVPVTIEAPAVQASMQEMPEHPPTGGTIELEAQGVRLILRGDVNGTRLRTVLDVLGWRS